MSSPSPVHCDDVALASTLDAGYTLPAEWYTSPSMFREEQSRIFGRSWQYVGLLDQVPQPGDFFTLNLGRVPIIVLRDAQGKLKAFINVCRHRGSQLVVDPCGTRKSLQCHYHAWTYDLNGELRAAPGGSEQEGFDKSEFGLVSAQIDTWGPLIFVNPDPEASPFQALLGRLPDLTAATKVPLGRIKKRVEQRYEIRANWKVVIDNYLECYHCPTAHPAFSDLIDVNNYEVTEYEYFSTQGGRVRESAHRKSNLYEIGEGVEDGFYAFLWPNFTINIYPGPGNVSLNLFVPLDVDRTLAIYQYCFVDEVADDVVDEFVRFIDQVQREDIVLCESVQRGLGSGYFSQGKLMLTREKALRHFQRLVYGASAS